MENNRWKKFLANRENLAEVLAMVDQVLGILAVPAGALDLDNVRNRIEGAWKAGNYSYLTPVECKIIFIAEKMKKNNFLLA
jgi:hypothetical protein